MHLVPQIQNPISSERSQKEEDNSGKNRKMYRPRLSGRYKISRQAHGRRSGGVYLSPPLMGVASVDRMKYPGNTESPRETIEKSVELAPKALTMETPVGVNRKMANIMPMSKLRQILRMISISNPYYRPKSEQKGRFGQPLTTGTTHWGEGRL